MGLMNVLVAGFEHEDDARRFLDAMRERFAASASNNSRGDQGSIAC
jgi:hypothetical protein